MSDADSSQEEVWKDIPDCPLYQASSLGRIRKLQRLSPPYLLGPQVLKGRIDSRSNNGYPVHHLFVNRRYIRVKTAVLVLRAFVGPRPPGHVSRHLDDNRLNSRADNLAWGTQYENVLDMMRNGHQAKGSRHGRSKLTEDQVREVRKRKAAGERSRALAKAFGVERRMIDRICSGTHWGHIV